MHHKSFQNWFLLISLAFIWGSSYFLIKISLVSFTPLQVGLLRIGLAGLSLLPYGLLHAKDTSRSVWIWCFLLGVIGFMIPFLAFSFAQTVIQSSLAGMLNSLQPLFTLIIGVSFFKARLPRNQIIGVVIGFVGAIILLGVKSSIASYMDNFLFSLLVVLATVCYGVAGNIIRVHLHEVSPLKITAISLGLCVLPIAAILLPTDLIQRVQAEETPWAAINSLIFLSVIGTSVAVTLYNKLIKDAGMMMASTVTYLIPVVAIFWGVLDGEDIYLAHFVGICVIFIGLHLVNKNKATISE